MNAQEQMSDIAVVIKETGDESIARKVIEASRQLYAKKVKPEKVPTEPKQEDTPEVSKKNVKLKKNRASKKTDDELSTAKSVTKVLPDLIKILLILYFVL